MQYNLDFEQVNRKEVRFKVKIISEVQAVLQVTSLDVRLIAMKIYSLGSYIHVMLIQSMHIRLIKTNMTPSVWDTVNLRVNSLCCVCHTQQKKFIKICLKNPSQIPLELYHYMDSST